MIIANMGFNLFAAVLFASLAAMPVLANAASETSASSETMSMRMDMPVDAPIVPAVNGFLDGEKILFIHTETSDPEIAGILTDMMGGSPVLVVPELANAHEAMLAPVYVFTNGYSGMGPMGPLGGQPDIFVNAPGKTGYSPLRKVFTVTWNADASVAVLKSYEDLKKAIDSGAVRVAETGIIVNMPLLTWPGGKR